jgi:di/tricarboxylate transporter
LSLPQILAFAVVIGMMALFVWGRFRYDLVAAVALLAAVAVGIVPYEAAFTGFSDEIVIIVASALLVSGGIARSGLMEHFVQRFAPGLTGVRGQMLLLVGVVTILSAFVKNIGALAIMIPIAFQMARRSGVSPSVFLMPMSFGALLGGLMTQIGTSPNIIVSRVAEELTGRPFTMFDFTPVGGVLATVGLVFIVLFYWLVPARTRATGSLDEALDIKNYTTEARVMASSALLGQTIADLHHLAEGEAMVTSVLRRDGRTARPLPDAHLREGDVVLLEGHPDALDRVVAQGGLELSKDRQHEPDPEDEIGAVEAVVQETSRLVGVSAKRLSLFEDFGVNLLAVSRRDKRFTDRLGTIQLRAGDVIVLQGHSKRLPDVLRELGCLPLAERSIRLGSVRRGLVPFAILAAAMTMTALSILPVAVAFFGAAVLMVLFRAIPLKEAYQTIEWPILVMLGALIPVSDALRTTGATDLIADWLSVAASALPAWGALALIMLAAMAVTPFLNNAATVLVMAPIAASFATDLGYRPEAFLMAVAIGAGSDFLTPIGHQCNTLVMGPGGYRFGDYWRLGLPLSVLVVAFGVPLLMLVWPMS